MAPVPVEDVEATIPFLPRPVAAMVRIQLLTGCRAGRGRGDPGVRPDAGRTGLGVPARRRHKNAWRGKARVIPLGPKAVEVLKPFLGPISTAYISRPSDAVAAHHANRAAGRKSRPTPSEKAKRTAGGPGGKHAAKYNRRSYRQAIVRACDRAFPRPALAGVKPREMTPDQRRELGEWRKAHRWTPLQVRHTAATTIRARYDRETATAILGHADPKVTERYAEVNMERARSVMAEVG